MRPNMCWQADTPASKVGRGIPSSTLHWQFSRTTAAGYARAGFTAHSMRAGRKGAVACVSARHVKPHRMMTWVCSRES